MRTLRRPRRMREAAEKERRAGRTIGFVPTMGALHEGHLSLIRKARAENDRVAVSIFVNPLQFGPGEDFEKYPRLPAGDRRLLKKESVDYLFFPDRSDMYLPSFQSSVRVGNLTRSLCGPYRPGHFEGVTTVVAKLFNAVAPHRAYFGAKDYQQAVVIRRMVHDLNMGLTVRILPIVREKDGLAMSSRNRYLNPQERERALSLPRTLFWMRREARKQGADLAGIRRRARARLRKEVTKIDYVEIVDAESLVPLKKKAGKMVAAAAVYVGKTRLIDNVIITLPRRSEASRKKSS